MHENTVQAQAAETLLERGVRFSIPAPFFLRLFGKKAVNLTIYPPKMGTLIAFSGKYVAMGIDTKGLESGEVGEVTLLIAQHGKDITEAIAVAVLNSKWKIRLFGRMAGRWLMWKLTPQRMAELFMVITMMSGYKDFTTIIRFLPSTNMMKMRKQTENLSQETSGSQEDEQ